MKTITGAILLHASSICLLTAAIQYSNYDFRHICGLIGLVFFVLGLYFLFFARDKPGT